MWKAVHNRPSYYKAEVTLSWEFLESCLSEPNKIMAIRRLKNFGNPPYSGYPHPYIGLKDAKEIVEDAAQYTDVSHWPYIDA